MNNSFDCIKKTIDLPYLFTGYMTSHSLKTSKKVKSQIYNLLYDLANIQFKKYNPCKIKNKACHQAHCFNAVNWKNCCGKCKYLSSKGCTIKNLNCKLYFCGIHGYDTLSNYLGYLREIAKLYNIQHGCFKPKKDILK